MSAKRKKELDVYQKYVKLREITGGRRGERKERDKWSATILMVKTL